MSFILTILEILFVDILLSGDNAVIIAMASASLHAHQKKLAIRLGVTIAVAIRLILMLFANALLSIPFVGIVGGLVLCFVAFSFKPHEKAKPLPQSTDRKSFYNALKVIVVSDVVMSLDNVLAIAAITKDNKYLLIFGVVMSIIMMLFMSEIISRLLEKYTFIFWVGVSFIGFVGGRLIFHDQLLQKYIQPEWMMYVFAAICALIVLLGRYVCFRCRQQSVENKK